MRWGLKSPENPLRTPERSHQGGDWLPSPGKIEEGAASGRAGPLSGPQRPADPSGPDIMPACYLFHGAPRPLLLRWLVVRPLAEEKKKARKGDETKAAQRQPRPTFLPLVVLHIFPLLKTLSLFPLPLLFSRGI